MCVILVFKFAVYYFVLVLSLLIQIYSHELNIDFQNVRIRLLGLLKNQLTLKGVDLFHEQFVC